MFIHENIPDVTLSEIVKKVPPKFYKRMPQKLSDFCLELEQKPSFYFNYSNISIDTVIAQRFHNQILEFLETQNAIKYSINDTLQMAGIPNPLAITYYKPGFDRKKPLVVNDFSILYDLPSGKLWLPPHHVAKVTQFGRVPETVCKLLRHYVRYALKCEDKDFETLQAELNTLANYGVLDESFFNELNQPQPNNAEIIQKQ